MFVCETYRYKKPRELDLVTTCTPEVVHASFLDYSVHRKYDMTVSGLARWRLEIAFAWWKTIFIWKPRAFICWYWRLDNTVKFLCACLILLPLLGHCNIAFFFLLLSCLSRSWAKWNWNKVFAGRRSHISDDWWQGRDERPNVKSHASAPFPPSSPELQCIFFTVIKDCRRGLCHQSCAYTQTHIPPLSCLLACFSLTPSPFLPLSLRYDVLLRVWKQPTQFWLNEHAKSFEPLGFWILLCYFVVFVVKPWMTVC